MSETNTKIKFQVEGIQALRDDMSKILKDTITQSKLLIDTNKEFIGVVKQQIDLLKERRDLMNPVNGSQIPSVSNVAPNFIPPRVNTPGDPQSQTRVAPGYIDGLNVPGADQPITRNQAEIKRTVRQLAQAILDQKKLVDGTKDYIAQQQQLLERTKDVNEKKLIKEEINAAKKALREDQGDLRDLTRQREQARLNIDGSSEQKEKQGLNIGKLQSLGAAMLINPLNTRDPFQGGIDMGQDASSVMMLSGGKMGWYGLALGAVVGLGKMQYDMLTDIETPAAKMARLQGERPEKYLDFRRNKYASIGVGRAEMLENRAELLKALGRDSSNDLTGLLALQKGFDVSSGDLLGLARTGRGENDFNMSRVFSGLYTGLQYAGLGKEKTEALIPDYLKLLTELGQEQLSTLGEVNSGINTRLITALSGESRLQSPEALRTAIQSITKGLSEAPTPQLEALQFRSISKAFPGKSYWDIEKIRQAPLAEGNEQYLPEYMRSIKSMTSSRTEFEMAVSAAFKLSPLIAESVVEAFNKGDFDQLTKEIKPGLSQDDILKRAGEAVNRFDRVVGEFENFKTGLLTEDTSNAITRIANSLEKLGQDKKISTSDALKTPLGPAYTSIMALYSLFK